MECRARSALEVSEIFCNMPKTLNNIETVIDYMVEITGGSHRELIERSVNPHLTDINDYMQALKVICEKMKGELDSMLELNVQKVSRLKTEMNCLQLRLIDKSVQVEKLREEKERTETSYDNAKTQLENACKALSEAEKNLDNAKDAQTSVGIGGTPILVAAPFTFFIPIIGPYVAAYTAVLGSSMVVASLTVMQSDINKNRSVVCSAQNNKSSFETSLDNTNKKLTNLLSEIETSCETEQRLKTETDCVSSSIEDIKKMQRKMSKFLQMFNTGFHLLTVASGRSRVLRSSSMYAYNLNHLKPILEAFCESFLLFAETEMFDSLDVYRKIDLDQIRRIRNKVKNKQDIRTPQLTMRRLLFMILKKLFYW